jgi:hypothetical protein
MRLVERRADDEPMHDQTEQEHARDHGDHGNERI